MTSSSTAFRKYIVRTAILGRSKGKGDTEKNWPIREEEGRRMKRRKKNRKTKNEEEIRKKT